MRQALSMLCLALAVGCSESSPVSPVSQRTPPQPVLGSFSFPQAIQVGEAVEVLVPAKGSDAYHFTLVAPTDGTLMARVTWEALTDFLQMRVGGTMFGALVRNGDEDPDSLVSYSTVNGKRSLVGSVTVIGGSSYRIWVASVPGYWDDGGWLGSSFTLTTSMQ